MHRHIPDLTYAVEEGHPIMEIFGDAKRGVLKDMGGGASHSAWSVGRWLFLGTAASTLSAANANRPCFRLSRIEPGSGP